MSSKTREFGTLLEAVPDALVGMDQAGAIRFVNHQTESLFGYDRDDLVGQPIQMLVPEYLWEVYSEHQEMYFADPRSRSRGLDLELGAKQRDGSEFLANISLSHLDTGDVLLVITAVREVAGHAQALEDSKLLAAIVEHSNDAIVAKTLDGIVTSWNPAAERMYGYSSEEMLGTSIDRLSPQGCTGEIISILARIKAGLEVNPFETLRARKDGTVFPVSLTVSPIRDADGVVVGASTITRDMTKEKEVFDAARSMIESSLDALVAISPQGLITDANEATVKATGIPRVELIGTAFSDHFTDPEKANAIYQLVFARGIAVDYPLTMRHLDGTLTEVLYNASVYRDAAGKVLGVFAAARDVTEARQAFEAAQRLAAIVESSDDAIIGTTLEGIVTTWNAAAERMLGYSSAEIISKSEALLNDTDRAEARPAAQAAIGAGQKVDRFETMLTRKDGTRFPASCTLSAISGADGRVVGASTIAHDLTEQVQKERAMAEASQQYRLLAENASDVVALSGPDRRAIWVSPSVTRTLGWAPEELVGTVLSDLVHPDDENATLAARDTLFAGQQATPPSGGFVMRMRCKSGDYRWVAVSATPVTDESGSSAGVVGGFRDVEALVHAREVAETDRTTLRATIDSLMDPHVRYETVRDQSGQIVDFVYVDANPAACGYLGMDYQDLVGTRMLDMFPGTAGAGLLAQYRQVAETGEPLRLDDVVYAQELMGGRERRMDISTTAVGGGLSQTWRDVTDRYVAAQSLAESQDRYRLLAENASDVVFMAGPDGRIVWIAPSVSAVLGWDPGELVGTSIADLLRPDYKIATAQDGMEFYTKGHNVNPEGGYLFELRTKSGDYRWLSGRGRALTEPDGTPVGLVAGLRDVTDLMKAREEAQGLSNALQNSNDSLRDFVAVAAHDLRSPLVTIGGFTEILTDTWAALSDEARLKQLGAIGRGVDRLSRLTNDLLASARVEAAAEQARPEHIRLATALASYLEANCEELGTVAVTCPAELVAVVDPSHLSRILDNYLTNAFKYGDPPICIEAERIGDFVELRVRDHGRGVPPEFVSRLFTKFDRADTPTTRATQGTGLGLSIVKTLAEANHGDARYQQNEPNGGFFVVRLPAAAA